jgi:GDP-L-fucose synthase
MKKYNLLITGHKGLVGSSLVNYYKNNNKYKIFFFKNFDLRNYNSLNKRIKKKKIHFIINAAAKTGGILSNARNKIQMLEENFIIQNNIIKSAYKNKIKKLIFLGSSCVYPRKAMTPIKEEYLLDGKLEETNEGYALAKIAGIKLCQFYNNKYNTDFRSIMPCNLYGINDKYDVINGHVIPSLIKKIINNKKSFTIWGTGRPLREFLHVNDLCFAIDILLNMSRKKFKKITNNLFLINIGYGRNISIKSLARLINKISKKKKIINFDKNKPDGVYNKILDSSVIRKNTKWSPKVTLQQGIKEILRKK